MAESRIIEMAKKSNRWMAQFDANIVRIIESKDDKLIDLNRQQMVKHKDSNDAALINESTGKTTLTKAYAKKTGKAKPNFLETGLFQDSMAFIMPNANEYFIFSKQRQYLNKNYGGTIFGVAPSNKDKADKITTPAIINDYIQKVFRW